MQGRTGRRRPVAARQGDSAMARPVLTPVQRQVARVSRRLLIQSLLNCLAWCWAGALVLTASWFLVRPLVVAEPPSWLHGTVAGGLFGAATVLGVVLAVLRTPNKVAAALALDE